MLANNIAELERKLPDVYMDSNSYWWQEESKTLWVDLAHDCYEQMKEETCQVFIEGLESIEGVNRVLIAREVSPPDDDIREREFWVDQEFEDSPQLVESILKDGAFPAQTLKPIYDSNPSKLVPLSGWDYAL